MLNKSVSVSVTYGLYDSMLRVQCDTIAILLCCIEMDGRYPSQSPSGCLRASVDDVAFSLPVMLCHSMLWYVMLVVLLAW